MPKAPRHARYADVAVPYPKRSRWAVGVVLALGAAGAQLDVARLSPAQQLYIPHYFRASVVAWIASHVPIAPENDYPTLDFRYRSSPNWRLAPASIIQRDAAGQPEFIPAAIRAGGHSLQWNQWRMAHVPYRDLVRDFYGGRSLLALFPFALFIGLPGLALGMIFGKLADWRYEKKIRDGVPIRGPLFTDRHTFNCVRQSDGIGFGTTNPLTLRERVAAPRAPRRDLAIPKKLEEYHMLIMGDTGTGKSVLIRQLLRAIQARGEVAVVYDPAGEFTAEFYNEARGDVILNPLDQRCPYWPPTAELATNNEALALAESLYPDADHETAQFFRITPRQIFAHLIQFEPDPETLAYWLATPAEIDRRVAGTEMAQMLSKGAPAQRNGVLASLGASATSFRLLPLQDETTRTWMAREWAKQRQAWIFFTAKTTTLTAQLPLISMWIDTIILRLMASDHPTPVWLVLDELASLQKLPKLDTALTMARKYHLKVILGFQVKSQLEKIYGRYGAETVLSMPATKVFLRTSNPDTEWISKAIGDHDLARARETQSHSDGARAGSSTSQAWEVRTERAVSPAQITGLPNLTGYLKNENLVVPFTLAIVPAVRNVEAMIFRDDALAFTPLILPSDAAAAPSEPACEAGPQAAAEPGNPPGDSHPVAPQQTPGPSQVAPQSSADDFAVIAAFMDGATAQAPPEPPAPTPSPERPTDPKPGTPAPRPASTANTDPARDDIEPPFHGLEAL